MPSQLQLCAVLITGILIKCANEQSRTEAVNTPVWSSSGGLASKNHKKRCRDNFLSLQITVFLAVHAKSLRNTSDFISASLEEFIFLFWDLGSLSPFIDLRYIPEWQLNVQETWQSWSWHSRVNTFTLERNQQGRGSCGQFSDRNPADSTL